MEYFKGKIELDSEFSEERRKKFKDFLGYLIKQNKYAMKKTFDLLIRVNKSKDLKCEGNFSNPNWMEHNENFGYKIFATFPEYENDSIKDCLNILAHEYRHFIQEIGDVTAHEGDARIWANKIVEDYIEG